jgi:hypothetical protein
MDYNKLLEKAHKVYAECVTNAEKRRLESLFPELAENEDKKIRKEIINYFKCQSREEPSRKDIHNKWISWLKKQSEKSDYNPYKATVESIVAMVEKYANGDLKDFYDNIKVKCKDAMEYDKTWNEKQDEQKIAWSEEDEKQLERAIYMMEQLNMTKSWDDVYNWLKSLKPQPHWKPTEEQMEDLKYAINMVDKCCEDSLQSLYNELEKL